MTTYLVNPFVKLAGTKALLIGIGMILIGAAASIVIPSHFDGALDLHFSGPSKRNWINLILVSISENAINVTTLGIIFSIFAFILVGKRFRVIDIFGTIAYARFPLYLAMFLNIGGFFSTVSGKFAKNIQHADSPALTVPEWTLFLIGSTTMLLAAIWLIYLLYKAFSISAGVTGTKAVIGFTIALLISEIASKFIHHAIIPSLL
jgi:hypothetical protein